MLGSRAFAVVCVSSVLLLFAPHSKAQTAFAARGNLDCNGFSAVQAPLRAYLPCADFRSTEYNGRGYDNGHYIGHDEPSIGFISTARHSGNNVQWDITLPVEKPLPVVQSFENYVTFWFAMALCDTKSFPNGPCKPNSDENTPFLAGSAFMELQLYPPGFVDGISCDTTHWCAALNIDSIEVMSDGNQNPNCGEPVNFALLQRNGVPAGPPAPNNANNSTFTPNSETLLMNQGDHLRITVKDTSAGLLTRIEDLTTGQSGFMVASGKNGFQNTDPNTCAGTNYNFHPEYDTAKFGNFVPWAVLQSNINFSMEVGHFEPLSKGKDKDDRNCANGPMDLVPGCLGADVDFDGTSYLTDWPDGSANHPNSFALRSVRGGGIGPLSSSDGNGNFTEPYPIVHIQTTVPDSESTCTTDGAGCVVPPKTARFYPYYSLVGAPSDGSAGVQNCALVFGNISGPGVNNFGRDEEYGPSNLPWFFGQNSGGPMANPCLPQTGH